MSVYLCAHLFLVQDKNVFLHKKRSSSCKSKSMASLFLAAGVFGENVGLLALVGELDGFGSFHASLVSMGYF